MNRNPEIPTQVVVVNPSTHLVEVQNLTDRPLVCEAMQLGGKLVSVDGKPLVEKPGCTRMTAKK